MLKSRYTQVLGLYCNVIVLYNLIATVYNILGTYINLVMHHKIYTYIVCIALWPLHYIVTLFYYSFLNKLDVKRVDDI